MNIFFKLNQEEEEEEKNNNNNNKKRKEIVNCRKDHRDDCTGFNSEEE